MKKSQTTEGIVLEQIWEVFNEGKASDEEFMLTLSQERKIIDFLKSYAEIKSGKIATVDAEELFEEYSEELEGHHYLAGVFVDHNNFIKAINSLK